VYRDRAGVGTRLALGFVAGLALWVNQLVGTTLVVMLLVLWRRGLWNRRLAAAGVGFLVGVLPLLVGLSRSPTAMPSTLTRKFFLMNRVKGAERFGEDRALHGAWQRVAALAQGPGNVGTVLGAAAPGRGRSVRWALLGSAPLLLLLLSCFHGLGRAREGGWSGSHGLVLLLLAGVIGVGYHSARYMLVAYPLAALLAGTWWADGPRSRLAACLIGAMLATNAVALTAWARATPLDRAGTLIATLERIGCSRGYSAGPLYHVVYRTREAIVLAALQKNRIPEYDRVVAADPEPCYVYRADQTRKSQHRQFLQELAAAGITYESVASPPYQVLHRFTPRSALTAQLVERARKGPSDAAHDDATTAR
jgi:hypothetical protein